MPNEFFEQDAYQYQIEVPKYVCDKKEALKSGTTIIRLSGEDASKLKYDWSVNFNSISDNCRQKQRCTLLAWRSVRDLEKHLRRVSSAEKDLQQINIDNSMLMPEIQYVLDVTIMRNGAKVDSKQFMLECTNSSNVVGNDSKSKPEQQNPKPEQENPKPEQQNPKPEQQNPKPEQQNPTPEQQNSQLQSIVLLGSNVTYRDMVYILNAEAEGCDLNCSYYWEVLDAANNLVLKESTKRSKFLLHSHLLNVTRDYVIRCNLTNTQKNTVTTALQNLKVLKRGMVLKLSAATLVVGPQQPLKLTAYFKDVDNSVGVTQIEWSCRTLNQRHCRNFRSVNSTVVESRGFPVTGRYNVTITVIKETEIKSDSCEIIVVENGFVKFDVDNVREPVDPTKQIQIPVEVWDLIAGCTLQWISVQEKNYDYIDLAEIPGNLDITTNVTLKEDEFLNEIDEYSNNTIDMDYNLKIPAPKGDWTGLKGYSSYLFRLNVTCPVLSAAADDGDETEEPVLDQKSVTVYADIAVKTDAPPALNGLEVTPAEGVALKTVFQFSTDELNGSNVDYPILYKFGYFLNDQIIFVSNLLGVTSTKGVFPYLDEGVKTVLEGCNSHSLCSQKLGPVVTTKISSFSEEDHMSFSSRLTQLMRHEEYYKAFTYSLVVIQTYRKIHNETLAGNIQNHILNLTSSEIMRLLDRNGVENWKFLADDFMRNIRVLLDNIRVPQELINNVAALRDKLSDSKSGKSSEPLVIIKRHTRKLLSMDESPRFKRQSELTTLEEVKNYFIISELIITTSPDKSKVRQERQNLLEQVDVFLQGLCRTLYEKPQAMNLELKTVILTLEKVSKASLNRYSHILYNDNSWKINGRLKLGKCLIDKLRYNNRLCVGKVAFKNYLSKKGIVFMTKIYSAEPEDQEYLEDLPCDSIFVLPINEKQIEGKEAKCALWKKRWLQAPCRTLQSSDKTVQCACSNLGYYTLEYNSILTTSTSALSTAAPSVTTIKSPIVVDDSSVVSLMTSTEELATTAATEKGFMNETISSVSSNFQTAVYGDEFHTSTETTLSTSEYNVTEQGFRATVDQSSQNISLAAFYAPQSEGEVVLYFLIGFSLAGIGILLYGIKRLLYKAENAPRNNFPSYAPLFHEDTLQEVPLTPET